MEDTQSLSFLGSVCVGGEGGWSDPRLVRVLKWHVCLELPADHAGGRAPQVGCKALVFPKQFKSQQYYNILKQICPELEKAQPGALKSQR